MKTSSGVKIALKWSFHNPTPSSSFKSSRKSLREDTSARIPLAWNTMNSAKPIQINLTLLTIQVVINPKTDNLKHGAAGINHSQKDSHPRSIINTRP
jgi:hypothetical protein